MAILRLILFAFSTLGTFELIRFVSRDKVNIYFLPSLTIAFQVSFLFIAGLLNFLRYATLFLYLLGFAFLVFRIVKAKGVSFIKSYLNAGYIVLALWLVVLAIYLKGKIFAHYDNFSHWALVVRQMLQTNRYPNFQDVIIGFQEYPLGSSTYIYYFAKLVSPSESVQMLAQAYMLLCAMLPLFYFARKNQILNAVCVISFMNYIMLYDIKVTDLLVDTLLPLVAVCALLFVYIHCKDGEKISLYFSAL